MIVVILQILNHKLYYWAFADRRKVREDGSADHGTTVAGRMLSTAIGAHHDAPLNRKTHSKTRKTNEFAFKFLISLSHFETSLLDGHWEPQKTAMNFIVWNYLRSDVSYQLSSEDESLLAGPQAADELCKMSLQYLPHIWHNQTVKDGM